ncbi:MAG: biopolymer transporter ExbD [Rhodopirellula sp. JB044]|uniref:biopolymer transporter ExbD n=1 Tax=Rhodopirellula sp. JB044 TaxID=3342844 RepID=UPI00370C9CFB
MKAPSPHRSGSDEIAMTSMIDVVFLLLVFFVWTSSFDKPESDLASGVAVSPASTDPTEPDTAQSNPAETPATFVANRREELVIRILAGPDTLLAGPDTLANTENLRYQVGAVAIPNVAQLTDKLKRLASLRRNSIVIIDPDDTVTAERCIEVFDTARSVGFANVLFAIDRPTDPEG